MKIAKFIPQLPPYRRLKSGSDIPENRLKVGSQAVYNLLSAGFKKYQASDSSDASSGTKTLAFVKMIYCS